MINKFDQTANQILDSIIEERRSKRQFKPEKPPKEMIEAIIRAGILAPCVDFTPATVRRKFVVLEQGKDTIKKAHELIQQQAKTDAEQLNQLMQKDPIIQEKGKAFSYVINASAKHGAGIDKAPYYIIIAEYKGIPPVEKQTIAHCLENMWLKATALGLGFQIITLTSMMTENKEFMDLLGIPYGEYEINGCLVGYSDINPPKKEEISVDEITTWL